MTLAHSPLSHFEDFLAHSLNGILSQDRDCPDHLAQSIRYSLLSPGKRIRPRLLLSCAEMVGLSTEAALPAAAALEMIHCFTLIHDDLPCMDNDDFRRGLPSNHKKFGESTALLAGDALIALAIELFLKTPLDSSRVLGGLRQLTWAMGPRGVIGGQAAESLLGKTSTLEQLQKMHAQKTGALFLVALLIPKEFAGISDESSGGKTILDFGRSLGLAFQVADDLEDVSESPQNVLFYQSSGEASRTAIESLQLSTDHLMGQWGDRAKILQSISYEVIQKIKAAQGSSALKGHS